MTYFVTGATGFIGRNLMERLLGNRNGKIYVLVREGSTGRLDDLIDRWSDRDRRARGETHHPRGRRPAPPAAGASTRSRSPSCGARSTTSCTWRRSTT